MNVMSHIVEVDFFVVVTMIFLRLFLRANDAYDHDLNTHIKHTIWMMLALAVFDTMDAIFAAQETVSPLRIWFIGARFALRPYLLCAAVMIFRQYQFSKKERWQLVLPSFGNMLIVLSAIFNPWVFSLDESGGFHLYLFGFLSYMVCLYYFIVAVGIALKQRERGFTEEAGIIIAAVVTMALGLLAEIIYNERGAFCGTIGLTLSFYYLYRHMDGSRRDTLTGAFNRSSFFADLAKMHPEQITAFCEFDMNNLKEINDKQGHFEGDRAIVAMHAMIQDNLPPSSSHLYRFGGDEFAVLFFNVNMSTVYGTIFRIREEFDKSQYGCAIGVAEWKEGNTFREVYNLADEQMYADKKKQKEAAKLKKAAEAAETATENEKIRPD